MVLAGLEIFSSEEHTKQKDQGVESEEMGAWRLQLSKERAETLKRVWSAVFYATASFLIVVINKVVLTTYKFPSYQVLGLGQMVVAIVALFSAKQLNLVSFPDFSLEVTKKIWPLPLFYLGNLVCGLGGTQKLNLPMFTVLRRFSILFTMILEYIVLRVSATFSVQLSVSLMIIGAIVASSADLAFDTMGYVLITVNNVCTAGNGVYTKKKLDAQFLGRYGLIFYNSFFMLIPTIALAVIGQEFQKAAAFKQWNNPVFLIYFLASCFMGFILNYATVLCTAYNSALTTTVVGVFKNLLITYLGMFIGNDYVFSWVNFVGLNISVIGSLIYSVITFRAKQSKSPVLSNGQITRV
ncbi:solute carrier family 35 member D2-like protein [Liolophura sinensis]|uniref:solute carrier family 35 member D2-like protein n=1 Tax=Liolophura sinensis TaxID=3198878 RepID=UPI00315899B2